MTIYKKSLVLKLDSRKKFTNQLTNMSQSIQRVNDTLNSSNWTLSEFNRITDRLVINLSNLVNNIRNKINLLKGIILDLCNLINRIIFKQIPVELKVKLEHPQNPSTGTNVRSFSGTISTNINNISHFNSTKNISSNINNISNSTKNISKTNTNHNIELNFTFETGSGTDGSDIFSRIKDRFSSFFNPNSLVKGAKTANSILGPLISASGTVFKHLEKKDLDSANRNGTPPSSKWTKLKGFTGKLGPLSTIADIGFGIADIIKSPKEERAGKIGEVAGKSIGGIAGGIGGAAGGGFLGSLIPIPGASVAGAVAGGFLGNKLGSFLGGKIGSKVGNFIGGVDFKGIGDSISSFFKPDTLLKGAKTANSILGPLISASGTVFKHLEKKDLDSANRNGTPPSSKWTKLKGFTGKLGPLSTIADIGFGIADIIKSPKEERAGKIGEVAGKSIGGIAGGIGGAAGGGFLGSLIPIPGASVAGAVAGGFLGNKLGSFLGGKIGSKVGNFIGGIDFKGIGDSIRNLTRSVFNFNPDKLLQTNRSTNPFSNRGSSKQYSMYSPFSENHVKETDQVTSEQFESFKVELFELLKQLLNKNNSIILPKMADTIVVREEADIDNIATKLETNLRNTGGLMA
ncbi:hypothetical protein [Chengkuizengella axinellae]|uniref:Glycine zipper domain-containing protein n=1 Tax=Chengkuizengella axinellae TaxID=3064388 RepID=A0ABT9IW08_9BACL|nr:hypothetical protein [Chengkuizengella sp. 2205SS18-9]MDP5273550.1 hypothetical protein [Chengkuizengella sp. 2205SS18-9]